MIIAFSGSKQAGKNTCANYMLGTILWMSGIVRETYQINKKGELLVSDIFGDKTKNGVFDTRLNSPSFQAFLKDHVFPLVKIYSFADPLKQLCHNMFGIDEQLLWGTDEDKNTLTNLTWANMPGIIDAENKKSKYMTVREVVEYVGTDIFRKMNDNIWIDALIRQIRKDNSLFPIITDCRFPNEVEAIQTHQGKVIRLSRGLESPHISNNALKDYKSFDYFINNKQMTIVEQNKVLDSIMKELEIHKFFKVEV